LSSWSFAASLTAGRVFAYDGVTGIALLVDGKCGVLVDVRNALDGQSTGWAKERLSKVEAIGYLEVKQVRMRHATRTHITTLQHVYPVSPPWSTVDPQLVLDAVLVVAAPELDLTLWNAVVAGLAQ